MAASFDSEIAVSINLDAPPIDAAGFGTTLLAALAGSLGAGFVERVRFYEAAKEAAEDADLSASLKDAVATAFAQTPTPAKFAIGRLDLLTTEITDITISGVAAGGDGQNWTATVRGLQAVYTQGAGDSDNAVAAGLAGAINALTGVSAAAVGAVITVTGDNAGEELNISVTPPAAAGAAAIAITTPAVTVGDGLDAILAGESNWYGLCVESRKAWDILSAAAWAEANKRLYIAQSGDADVKSGAYSVDATDVASKLRQAAYRQTALLYYADNTEWADVAWACNRLAVDPDRQTTIWKFVTLDGVAVSSITSTEKANILGKYANCYLTFFKQGSTGNGTAADGTKIDLVLTKDWLKARTEERFAQILLNATNRGQKVPYTDEGFAVFAASALSQLADGVAAGHFQAGTPYVDMPLRSAVSGADAAARKLAFSFGAAPAGAVESVTITGYVSLDIEA